MRPEPPSEAFDRRIVLRPSERPPARERRRRQSAADGAPERLEVYTFRVVGMTGEDDAELLRERLERLSGVEEATVHFGSEHASVMVTDPALDALWLREVVRTAGFEAVLEREAASTDRTHHELRALEVRRLMILAALGIPAWLLDLVADIRFSTSLPVDLYRRDLQFFLTAATVFWGARHLWWRVVALAARGRSALVAGLVEEGPAAVAIVIGFVAGAIGFVSGEYLGVLGATAALAVLAQGARTVEAVVRSSLSLARIGPEQLLPPTANVLRDGREFQIRTRHVAVGDLVVAREGEVCPVGGLIEEGSVVVDESPVTGRSAPVRRRVGDSVVAGCVLRSGHMVVRARRVWARTLLARIGAMAVEVGATRARSHASAERLAVAVTIAAGVASVAAVVITLVTRGPDAIGHAVMPLLAVLVAVSPRSVLLAVPIAAVGAMRMAARAGILVRDAETLESAARLQAVVLGRTGVLTEGRPVVRELRLLADMGEPEVLRLAAAVELRTRHPVGDAVVELARQRGVDIGALPPSVRSRTVRGQGVVAEVEGRSVAIGNAELAAAQGAQVPAVLAPTGGAAEPLALNFVVVDGQAVAVAMVHDPIRADAAQGVYLIRKRRLRPVMVTGEDPPVARAVAQIVGIREVHAGISPDRQKEIIREVARESGACGAVVGAEADAGLLEPAQVGFLLLSESRLPHDEAGVTLLRGTLDGVPATVTIARMLRAVVRQGLVATAIYHLLVLFAAALGLVHPVVAGLLSLLLTVGVAWNGNRTSNVRIRAGRTRRVAPPPEVPPA